VSDTARQVAIGIGNLERGDDAAGRIALRELRGRLSADVALIEESGEASELLATMEGAGAAYLIDACVSGAAPGTIHRFDAAVSPWPRALRSCSTHGLGLAEALELARALGMLPHRCVVYAIEGAAYDLGAPLSAPVRAQIDTLAARLAAEIEHDRGRHIAVPRRSQGR
jgi:hydrogenase maturation protease